MLLVATASIVRSDDDGRMVTLLVHGTSPWASDRASDETWGELRVTGEHQLQWSGFIGHLIRQGWAFGGVLRSRSEQLLSTDLDTLGASQQEPADFYSLASSVASQEDGLESRGRELATAVAVLRQLTHNRPLRLLCYSASGVSARVWMQGALPKCPYKTGAVKHLLTVATPHSGISGAVRIASSTRRKYAPLAAESALLRRINQELDLPGETRYMAVVIQGSGMEVGDTSQAYGPYLRLPAERLAALPPLMRCGNDGIVHCLSAQLHLTPSAARYENRLDRPVEVAFCRLSPTVGPNIRDVTLHTRALGDETVWRTLESLMSGGDTGRNSTLLSPDCWAKQMAQSLTERQIQSRHWAGRIIETKVAALQLSQLTDTQYRCRWQCDCVISVPTFRGSKSTACSVTGSFKMALDRFRRPEQLEDLVVDVTPADRVAVESVSKRTNR